MASIISQLGLDQTLFTQIGIFMGLFLVLSRIYFKPFQRHLDLRIEKTKEDRKRAEEMMKQAEKMVSDYQAKIHDARADAQKAYEQILSEARAEEAKVMESVRSKAKTITMEAIKKAETEKERIATEIEADVEGMARVLSDRLMEKKG